MGSVKKQKAFASKAAAWLTLVLPLGATAATADVAAQVAQLDIDYQAAVKRNDEAGMARILAEDFVLVSGGGLTFTREQLLAEARGRTITYEEQDVVPGTRTVRVFGEHTAVVTALLALKGVEQKTGRVHHRKLWFSDVYIRTDAGWKYALGQVGRLVEKDGQPVMP